MQTGQQIDHYTIQKPLGSGGMADVFLAWDQKNQWPVALKLMNMTAMSHPNAAERFKRDVGIASRLRHPHLVQVYGWGQVSDGRYYMVMEYINGGTLGDRIKQYAAAGRTMPEQDAAYLMRRVAGAMAYAHGQGIIHRDLKPANVLIRANSHEPVVADFGIAAEAGARQLTGTMEMLGTIPYMAPEQAREAEKAGAPADIYAMGVMLYEMLAGRMPFDAENVWAILNMKMTQDPRPLRQVQPRVNPALAAIVDTCLQRDPARRFASAAELAGALDKVIPTGAQSPPPAPRIRAKRKISPLAIIGSLAVVLLIVAIIAMNSGNKGGPANTTAPNTNGVVRSPQNTAGESGPAVTPPSITPTSTAEPPGIVEPGVVAVITDTPLPLISLPASVSPVPFRIGATSRGTPIEAVRFGNGPTNVVFVGGLNAGFAPGTVWLAERAVDHFERNPALIPDNVTLTIVLSASPDTPNVEGELAGRLNSNGVDANRNWGCRWKADTLWHSTVVPGAGGSAAFSEPEVKALADFLLSASPEAVVFWQARALDGLVSPGACQGRTQYGAALAGTYGSSAGYRVEDFETLTDQELNGDAMNWLDSVGIPAVGVLLPDYDDIDWQNNLDGMLAVLQMVAQ